jgi:hypothetical protein
MSVMINRAMPPFTTVSAQALSSCATAITTEQRWTIRIDVLEVGRDRPGIENNTIAVDQHGHTALTGEGDRVLILEVPRDGIERQALVGERELGTPAVRTEAAFHLRSGEIVEVQPHG